MDSKESGRKGGLADRKEQRVPFLESPELGRIPTTCYPESLLDVTIRLAIADVLDHLDGRKNKAGPNATLPPAATLELFAGTRDFLTESELKDLFPELDPQHARGEESARARRLNVLKRYAVELVRSRRMENAQVVSGWTLVLIYSAVMEVLRKSNQLQRDTVRQAIEEQRSQLAIVVQGVFDVLRHTVTKLVVESLEQVAGGNGFARTDAFIHACACGLTATMTRQEPWQDTQRLIIEGLYPELNAFGDPEEN